MPAQSQNLSSLLSCICNDFDMLAIAARSSTYVVEGIFTLDVPNVYPIFLCYNHLRRGSKNMMNKYGLRVSPCIVPLWMGMGCVLPKCSPMNVVADCDYMFPNRFMASFGYPRSFIMGRSLAWSMKPKAFLKFMYRMYRHASCLSDCRKLDPFACSNFTIPLQKSKWTSQHHIPHLEWFKIYILIFLANSNHL